jgi:hypothetical protein
MVKVIGLALASGVKDAIGSGDGRGVEVGIGLLVTNTAVSCGVIVGEGDGVTLALDGWHAALRMVNPPMIPSRPTSVKRDIFIVISVTVEASLPDSVLTCERRERSITALSCPG